MMKNFSGIAFGNKAAGFDSPTQMPRDDAQRREWQAANRAWWESTPMRYDWRDDIAAQPGTESYFAEIDRNFLSSVRKYMPWRNLPFDAVIPFDDLRAKDVLEIGVGQGTHAQLLAPRCKSFTGIDLTSHAVDMTSRRLKLFGISGNVLQMDAEAMNSADNSFDYIWSWGVIHHSADTLRVLQEMQRVLRRGGKCAVMIYHKSWWSFYVCGFLRGVFQGQFRNRVNLHSVAQCATDGAIARYYTRNEWRQTIRGLFEIESVQIYGLKSDILPLPHSRVKLFLENLVSDRVARILTRDLRGGTFLVAQMRALKSE
jgi:ubiquinone/menaquinone biosynthesis C-methylase UbiE